MRQVLLADRPVPVPGGGLEAREQQKWKSVRLFTCCGSDSNKSHLPKIKCLTQFSEPFYLVNLISKQLNDPAKLTFKALYWLCYPQEEQAERRNKALLFPPFTLSKLGLHLHFPPCNFPDGIPLFISSSWHTSWFLVCHQGEGILCVRRVKSETERSQKYLQDRLWKFGGRIM